MRIHEKINHTIEEKRVLGRLAREGARSSLGIAEKDSIVFQTYQESKEELHYLGDALDDEEKLRHDRLSNFVGVYENKAQIAEKFADFESYDEQVDMPKHLREVSASGRKSNRELNERAGKRARSLATLRVIVRKTELKEQGNGI
ncbi:MAG: hypothetical protein FWC00_04545 [Firmicutes bacterium]|nr:hypothetical protein [Bacillota bacterium]